MTEFIDWLKWNLWDKLWYRWKYRNDTLEQRKAALFEAFENMVEAFKDEPATKELCDAVEGMEEVRRVLNDRS